MFDVIVRCWAWILAIGTAASAIFVGRRLHRMQDDEERRRRTRQVEAQIRARDEAIRAYEAAQSARASEPRSLVDARREAETAWERALRARDDE
jgi:biopolymer transport protein ExbB/TolQ